MHVRRLVRRTIISVNAIFPLVALWLFFSGRGWLALAGIATAHALWLIPTLWPACAWCGEVVTTLRQTGAKAERCVWLTIDDGPDPVDTPRLLDLLDAHDAKATFFFIGAKAARHPQIVANVVKRGHSVGNHTMTHPQFWFWAFGLAAVKREITECQRVLTETTGGIAPRWFRAPAGLKNPFVSLVVEQQDLRLACWSARGLDGVSTDKNRVLQRLERGVRPGAILLMHEGRVAPDGGRLAPQILEAVLQSLRTNGYTCVLPG